jgi:N-acetylglucosamine kinase-like BadF-type ATPase
MNILIESGATKSTCIGYKGACTFFIYKTAGINATYATKESITAIFEEIITKNNIIVAEIENVRYYGAGCFNTNNAEKVKTALFELFPQANIAVFSDLYAACHALCNNRKGFVGILGTGSASCFYDGVEITDTAPSLGFMLGDEGSGTHIGKLFVKEYFTNKIDNDIAIDFEETFAVSKSIVLEKIYREAKPQAFFASIPIFLQKHLENNTIKKVIANSFQSFFNQQIDYYGKCNYPWFFCGSIAYYFQNILLETAHKNSIEIKEIIQECAGQLY